MSGLQIIFLIVAVITLLSALMLVVAKKTMHAAMWLVLTLLGVAILFATLQANFFAVVQLIVYIGAIAILILFAVMLTRGIREDEGGALHKRWWIAAIASVALFIGFLLAFNAWSQFGTPLIELPKNSENISALGQALVNPAEYLLPFEVASILLLAGMVAAIFLSVEAKGGSK